MYLEFSHPWVLLLLPAAVLLVLITAGALRASSGSRRIGLITLRCLVLAAAILAAAGMSIEKKSDRTTTIFLVDLSDSTAGVQADEAEFVREAIAQMGERDEAGIVVFGADAQIEQFVSDKKVFTSFEAEVNATATNLESAVQTALALFPEEQAKRLVLLTDGSENEGDVLNTVRSLTDRDVELKAVSYESAVSEEVYVSDVTLPDTIRQGNSFQVEAEIYASESTAATVSLYSGRTLKGSQDVILHKGYNRLLFADEGVESGLKSYRVTVEAEHDTVSVNNTYSAYTTVEAQARVLLVEGEAGKSVSFTPILDACGYAYDVVTPAGVPTGIAELNQYQTIILLDVYADDLRAGFLDSLTGYVQDYAGGLIAIGGSSSFALGNYKDTALEEVLPVSMDLVGEKEIPKLAMAMVIDHSGSMEDTSTENSSITCLSVAKQAAIRALDSLREIDEVGVLAFDDTFDWAVPLTEVTDADAIAEQIGRIAAGGGTSIYPALDEAVNALTESDAELKHIVLLTDGQDGFHEYSDVLTRMEENGITLSTVAIGEGADAGTLESLAEQGGGRYYYSDAGSALPRIFAQEVYLSAKSYLINEEFTPVIVNSHEIIEGIFDNGSPSLLGYIAVTPKTASTVILESDREDPILTIWQYGLGRTAAWNSDGTNEWTANFAGWDSYAALWRNIIDWTISDSELGEDTLNVTQEASSFLVEYETSDYSAETSVSALVTDEDGNQREITLTPVSPGVYQASVDMDETGIYSLNVRKKESGEVVKNINTAAALQYSGEYRFAEASGNLNTLLTQSGGRNITEPDEVFDTRLEGATARWELTQLLLILSLLLFVLDIALRRLGVDWVGGLTDRIGRAQTAVRAAAKRKRSVSKEPQKELGVSATQPDVSKQQPRSEQESLEEKAAPMQNQKEAEGGKESPRRKTKKKRADETNTIDTSLLLKKKQDRDL